MIDQQVYSDIARKYGQVASWAIWGEVGAKAKSNIGDLSIFDLEKNPKITERLNPDIILVGLNISRPICNKFGNFHDGGRHSQDYKIRHACSGTNLYGAYMTDVIKGVEERNSARVMSYLAANLDVVMQNLQSFEQELQDIKAKNPLLVAFGNYAFDLLDQYFKNKYQIIRIPHYSKYISKENYKIEVDGILNGLNYLN